MTTKIKPKNPEALKEILSPKELDLFTKVTDSELENIKVPTLLIIGQADRTIVGKAKVPKEIVDEHGQYPELGRAAKQKIKNAQLVELDNVRHIPHIQTPEKFEKALVDFLQSRN